MTHSTAVISYAKCSRVLATNLMNPSPRPGLVFISYKREEAAAAGRLREALVQEGFTVWWDEDLQCGQAWAEKLDTAVREATCIIVLWSARAVASPWVRHEASQAIARDVYAPCRIELVQLGSPYDRIQATDLIEWDGDRAQAGFGNLLKRVNTLVPAPVSRPRRIGQWLRANLGMLVASGIATVALWLLWIIFDAQRVDRLEKVYDCSASRELRVELALERYSKGEQLQNVCLTETYLRHVTLAGADLANATLAKANLAGANLTKAFLGEANLTKAFLANASLLMADLTRANLTKAFFGEADLTGANLTGAVLIDADLSRACADELPIGWPKNYAPLPPCQKHEKQ